MTKLSKPAQRNRRAKPELRLVSPSATFGVTVPEDIYLKVKTQLNRVGSTLDDFVRIAMRSYLKQQTLYDSHDVIQFGKYRGESVEALIRYDPDYIVWCLDNTQIFKLTPTAQALLEQVLQLKERETQDD